MKLKIGFLLCLAVTGISFHSITKKTDPITPIHIKWVDTLQGDFSFKEKWSYPAFIYKNSFGQLSCDGDCPVAIDRMKDESGKIHKDSLQAFYTLIDTTHLFHSLHSTNRMYEYSGTDFIAFEKSKNGILKGISSTNVSTRSSMHIKIDHDSCYAWVIFNSIRALKTTTFPLEKGTITIERTALKKGIVKAVFDFTFKNTITPDETLFWKGQIYSKVIPVLE